MGALTKTPAPLRLDIGCGTAKRPGFTGIDSRKNVAPDIVADIEKGLPTIKSDSVEYLYCSHTLEHIRNLESVLAEFWRVCRSSATIEIVVPYFASTGAFMDPTHVRFFTPETFKYFSKTQGSSARFDYNFPFDFKILDIKYKYLPVFRFLPFRKQLARLFLNIIVEFTVKMKVIK